MPWAATKHRLYLPLMPLAVEQFDLAQYDLILSSSHAVAKGVLRGPDQLHVSYVHSPLRYAWDLQHDYLRQSGLRRGPKLWLARQLLHYLRHWDQASANRVDVFVCNSQFVARRIHNCYRRRARVVYPPVDVEGCLFSPDKDDFYLTASRVVPYKRIDLIVDAFNAMPDRRLVVIGDGPGLASLRQRAGPNVSLLGYQSREVLLDPHAPLRGPWSLPPKKILASCRSRLRPAARPSLPSAKGGRETVVDGQTGLFFQEQTIPSLVGAIEQFESQRHRFDPYVAAKRRAV